MTHANICDCGWSEYESSDSFSPHRNKCPECGANFAHREEVRRFGQ